MASMDLSSHNVTSAAALLMVTDMERSLAFYLDGLGFKIEHRWEPNGKLRWCWMALGGAALMLQELNQPSQEKLGNGVAIYFQCRDALAIYREAASRGIHAALEPRVGNFAWEVFFVDPDGYKINFSSPTDLPEETLLSEFEV